MQYKTSQQAVISFPLGGIGAGCIGLAGNGALVDWEIFNQFFALPLENYTLSSSRSLFSPFHPNSQAFSSVPTRFSENSTTTAPRTFPSCSTATIPPTSSSCVAPAASTTASCTILRCEAGCAPTASSAAPTATRWTSTTAFCSSSSSTSCTRSPKSGAPWRSSARPWAGRGST